MEECTCLQDQSLPEWPQGSGHGCCCKGVQRGTWANPCGTQFINEAFEQLELAAVGGACSVCVFLQVARCVSA